MVGSRGEWQQDARLIRLLERTVVDPAEESAHVAGTVVHEATHAWLDDRGIAYRPERRRRIEALCIRSEARFASRIPGGAELANYYDTQARKVLAQSDAEWSDAAFRARSLEKLRELGTPHWFLRLLENRVRGPAG